MKFGQLILRRIVKVVATKCQILRLKCTKIDFGCSSAPDPTVGAYIFSVYCLCCEQRSAAGLRRCPFLRAILGLPVTVTAVLRRTVCGPNLVGGRSGKWRAQASNQPIECIPRVGHGSLLQNTTQPQISGPNPTHKSLHPTQPSPSSSLGMAH